jgi:hypothetical protein
MKVVSYRVVSASLSASIQCCAIDVHTSCLARLDPSLDVHPDSRLGLVARAEIFLLIRTDDLDPMPADLRRDRLPMQFATPSCLTPHRSSLHVPVVP